MRAVALDKTGDSSVLQVRDDMPKPTPKPSNVLVKVEWSGVNFYDTYIRIGVSKFPLPCTTGTEGAGTIEEVGADGVSTRDGAALLLQGLTAWTLVRDAHAVKPGEAVLV
ncbi:hypothetical protein MAPG_04211, partial [Magnaporthiopsis poae ATCC 64411]